MTTDLVYDLTQIYHRDKSVAGINAAFYDGHVAWQSAKRNPQAFLPSLWPNNQIPNTDTFRYIMSLWQP